MKDDLGTGNLDLWSKFADIDPRFTKKITGKQYQGTSPNPQYVIRCLTEMFGPVGKGFGWKVLREDFTPLGDEILHWCRVQFWWSDGDGVSSYESYGQTKALMKTRNGLLADEDAPKKSLTDAIVKAASHIGIAANIFLGRWDDQKYVSEVAADYREAEAPQKPDPERGFEESVAQALRGIAREQNLSGLSEFWADLYRNHRPVADDKRVISAKNKRKAELTPPRPDLDDEIPY